jgi:HK97 family phage portal protein
VRSLIGGVVNVLRGESPVPYTSTRLQLPTFARSNVSRQLKAMGAVGTLFAIVNRTSTSTAKVEWCLYRKSANGDPEDRTEVRRHLALDVWNQPNAFTSRMEFVEIIQQHIDLTGEMWWVVARDPRAPSIPIGLWPVRPDRIAPIPHPTKFIEAYEYTGPHGEKIRLELNEVIFVKMPNPDDPYRGMGPVQSILTEIDAVKYSAEWNRNFFINGAEPGGIIKAPKKLSDPEFDELQLRWAEGHQGVANAHRVAILENMEWVDRRFTNRDMQFVELRGVSSKIIREAFGMPKFGVGDLDDVNRATAHEASNWISEEILVPRLERIKGALNTRFLPLFGPGFERLEFDYHSPVKEDTELANQTRDSQVAAWVALVNAGVDPDDASMVVGLPTLKYEKPEPPALPPGPNPPPDEEATARLLRIVQMLGNQGPPGPPGPRGHRGERGFPARSMNGAGSSH